MQKKKNYKFEDMGMRIIKFWEVGRGGNGVKESIILMGDEWKGENNSCQRRKLYLFSYFIGVFGGQVWKCDWNKSGVGWMKNTKLPPIKKIIKNKNEKIVPVKNCPRQENIKRIMWDPRAQKIKPEKNGIV